MRDTIFSAEKTNRAVKSFDDLGSSVGRTAYTIKESMVVLIGDAMYHWKTWLRGRTVEQEEYNKAAQRYADEEVAIQRAKAEKIVSIEQWRYDTEKRQQEIDGKDLLKGQAEYDKRVEYLRSLAENKVNDASTRAVIEWKYVRLQEKAKADAKEYGTSVTLKMDLVDLERKKQAELNALAQIGREDGARLERQYSDSVVATAKARNEKTIQYWKVWLDDFAQVEKAAKEKQKRDDDWFAKSPADDPRVKERIAKRQMIDSKTGGAAGDKIFDLEQEKLAIEKWLGNPKNSPYLVHDRRVNILLEQEEIRSAEERKRRMEMDQQEKLALYAGFFGNLSTLLGAFGEQSKEMFLVAQLASIAQAEVNAWMAYSNVIAKESILGLVPAQIMAGVALAAGQVAVMNIAKQKPPGRANGGGVAPNTLYEVAERGPEMFESGGKSYLMNGGASGRVQPLGPGGGGRVTVNVNNLPGQTARVTEGGTQSQPTITIDIVDAMVAAAVSNGRSQTSRAMSGKYGLNAARGAQ
jgi:hypothetical protein